MSSRHRPKFTPQDLTDDEDSDIENFTDDSRSRIRKQEVRNRSRRNTEQLEQLDHRDNEVISRIQKMKEKSKFIRERRSGSLTNWPTTKGRDSGSLTPSDDELRKISSKHRKSSLTSPVPQNRRLLSDSASEKDLPDEHKERKSLPKVVQQAKSDSASERETKKAISSKGGKMKTKTDSDSEIDLPSQKLVSESRPLKVVAHNSQNDLKSSKEAPMKKEEKLKETAKPAKKEINSTASESFNAAESVNALENVRALDNSKAQKDSNAYESSKAHERPNVNGVSKAQQISKAQQSSKAPERVKASQITKAPESSKAQQIAKAQQNSEAPGSSRAQQASKVQATKSPTLSPTPEFEVKKKTSVIAEDWECPHCTFVNEASTTVCTICCKTHINVLNQLPTVEDDIDINEINDSILQNENDAKQKGKVRKISFLPGTKAH